MWKTSTSYNLVLAIGCLPSSCPFKSCEQEVDETFLPRDWKEGDLLPCGAPLVGYTPYRAYSVTKGVQVCAASCECIRVIGSIQFVC